MEQTERKALINKIVRSYVSSFTSAEFADSYSTTEREQDEANDKLFGQINEYNITQEEVKEVIEQIIKEAEESGSVYSYDLKLFSTKFFRK